MDLYSEPDFVADPHYEYSFLCYIREKLDIQKREVVFPDSDGEDYYHYYLKKYEEKKILKLKKKKGGDALVQVLNLDFLKKRYRSLKDFIENPEPPEPATRQEILNGNPRDFSEEERWEALETVGKGMNISIDGASMYVVRYFDLSFDFENGKYWKTGTNRKFSFAIEDAQGKQTRYLAFKILLANKGKALSKQELEDLGFVFTQTIVRDCEELDIYLRKNLQPKFNVSDDSVFKNARRWLKYNPEKKQIMLVSDED